MATSHRVMTAGTGDVYQFGIRWPDNPQGGAAGCYLLRAMCCSVESLSGVIDGSVVPRLGKMVNRNGKTVYGQ